MIRSAIVIGEGYGRAILFELHRKVGAVHLEDRGACITGDRANLFEENGGGGQIAHAVPCIIVTP